MNISNSARLAYERMLIKAEGLSFLYGDRFSEILKAPAQQVAIKYAVQGGRAIEELRRLLAIKSFTADTHADKISPTPIMDELWHAIILDTQFYADLQTALGVILHHRPSKASIQESEQRKQRLTAMKALYVAFFSTNPLESNEAIEGENGWNDFAPFVAKREPGGDDEDPELVERIERDSADEITVYIQKDKYSKFPLIVSKHTTINQLKPVIKARHKIPLPDQAWMFDGALVLEDVTLDQLGVVDKSTLEVHIRQVGC